MTPLPTTSVYVPVSVKDELPDTGNEVLCFDEKHGRMFKDEVPFEGGVTHWLKETSGYLLSKTELESLLRDTFEAGMARQEFLGGNLTTLTMPTGREQYIKQILP